MDRNPHTLSDEELVKLFIETKDTQLFSYIYDRYAKFVYNKSMQIVKCEENAKDITHDVFIKIYINISKFRFESKLSTWIYSITYNLCIDFLRNHQENIEHLEGDNIEEACDPNEEEQLERELFSINYQRLLEILDLLTVTEKNILLMKYQEDLSIKEISTILEITESAVKMRLLRAKKKVIELK